MKPLLTGLFAISCLFAVSTHAKTSDDQTPSEETICTVFQDAKGPAFGLCNAYCEAMDCGDPNQHAANPACASVNDNFEKHVGFRLPEGYNAVDENGNFINNCIRSAN